MGNYTVTPEIIDSSLNELKIIQNWVEENVDEPENPALVLIGGWAVDSYNPWYGSIDIDLVTNSEVRSKLKYYLRTEYGYLEIRQFPQMPSGIEKYTEAGRIIVDFIPKGVDNPFEGQGYTFYFSMIDGHTNLKEIRNACQMYVPTRTVLLFLKLKAVWDRYYRIYNNCCYSLEWEKSKLNKDKADIIALIDPKYGGEEIDLFQLAELIDSYPFLKQIFLNLKSDLDAIERYGRIEVDEFSRIFAPVENFFNH